MENKKMDFYTYVDDLQKKNDQIYRELQIKENIKHQEQRKIEEMKEIIKRNEVTNSHINDLNKNKELKYLDLKREVEIQKNKLYNLKGLLKELPENIKAEEEDYHEFKNKLNEQIKELLNSLDPYEQWQTTDTIWKNIRETQKKTNELNELIQQAYDNLRILNEAVEQSENEFQHFVQIEKNKKKKLRKIAATLQFIENLKSGVDKKHNRDVQAEHDLKKRLEDINNETY